MSWWETFLPKAVDIASTLYSQNSKNKADEESGAIANRANEEALAAQKAAANKAVALYEQNKLANQRIQDQTAGGLAQQQQAIADQNRLTPAQMKAVSDAREQMIGQMARTGLRGSGRATAAAVRDVEDRTTNRFMDTNRTRADQAASTLSNQYFGAGVNSQNQNQSIASIYQNTGKAEAGSVAQSGQNMAMLPAAKSDTNTEALGKIADILSGKSAINPDRALGTIKAEVNDSEKRKSMYSPQTYSGV